jgi:ATP-binding cassette, subfamily B, multidrug efflux pump
VRSADRGPHAAISAVGPGDDEDRFKPISWPMVRRLLGCMKICRRQYVLGTIISALSLALVMTHPHIIRVIIDDAIPSGSIRPVVLLCLLWAAVIAGHLFMEFLKIGVTQRAGERVINDLRMQIFYKLQQLSMSFYDRTRLGRIITRGTSDMDSLRPTLIDGVNTITINVLQVIGGGVVIFLIDRRIFLSLVGLMPVLFTVSVVYRRAVARQHQIARAGYSRVASNLAENITGARVVAAFNRQGENLERFNALQAINTVNNVRVAHVNGIFQPTLDFLRIVGQIILLSVSGVIVVTQGTDVADPLTVGKVVALIYYWNIFMQPAINIAAFNDQLMSAMASGERVFSLLDEPVPIYDKPGARDLARPRGEIRFDRVTFGYDPDKPVLHDIDLRIPAGGNVAVVGETGSGKSSTLALIARFYEFQQGRITIDDTDIRDVRLKSLHGQIGLVLQANFLFSGTIIDNIRYARPDTPDEKVFEAARSLGLHDTFMALPSGYLTEVGERGASLSLGLRQLVCFTRVFVADPGIFLLDEATSSIDTLTEGKIQAALARLVKGRTSVIVAHRLSTVVNADLIIVLDKGRIVEQGSHNELLDKEGLYAAMYERFTSAFVDEE